MRLRLACVVVILVVLQGFACAVGKATTDPNAKVVSRVVAGADESQHVTYEAKRKTVVSILADLSRMTGVTLKAGYNDVDWQVRDRRMNVFVKDVPLSELMDSVARVMKFQWSKREDDKGAVSYRLYMDRKSVIGAESARLAEDERVRQRQTKAREKLLSALEKAAKMSGDELETLREESPYLYAASKDGYGQQLTYLCRLPAVRQAFLAGEQWTGSVLDSAVGDESARHPSASTSQLLGRSTQALNSSDMSPVGGIVPSLIGSLRSTLYIDEHRSVTSTDQFFDPDSEYAKLWGRAYTASDAKEKERLTGEMQQAWTTETRDLGEPLYQHQDDAELNAELTVRPEGKQVADVLKALAESSGFGVVSDAFDRNYPGGGFVGGKMRMRAALDKLESDCRDNWERRGRMLEIHSRDWYRKRAAQIPEAQLETWRKAFATKGTLGLEELSQIAALTPEQLALNIDQDEVLEKAAVWESVAGTDDGGLLRMYGALDRQQRASILSGGGLSLDLLSDSESAAVQRVIQACSYSRRQLRMVGECMKIDGSDCYNFKIVDSSGKLAGPWWMVRCPRYGIANASE